MSRQIKFRCYDKIENKMWTPIIDREGIPCSQHPVSMQLVRMDGDLLYPIMQFTGLTDSEGKDIFESDVLETKGPVFPNPNKERFIAQWEDDIDGWSGWSFKSSVIINYGCKVIGNIYENPELAGDI